MSMKCRVEPLLSYEERLRLPFHIRFFSLLDSVDPNLSLPMLASAPFIVSIIRGMSFIQVNLLARTFFLLRISPLPFCLTGSESQDPEGPHLEL